MKKITQQEQFLRMLESSDSIFNVERCNNNTDTIEVTVNPNSQHKLYAYFDALGNMIAIRSA